MIKCCCVILVVWGLFNGADAVHADVMEYDLTIAETPVNITGHSVLGMAINGSIPGPTLQFREGDSAVIHVHNEMNVETSIHWHGLLVPPGMDGVPFISFPPIKPGATYTYTFPIRQSGTYWYHSHTMLQEQSGVYGAIAIEPKEAEVAFDRDYAVVLSDWTDTNPHSVLRTLKRGSEWFAIEKGSAQSVVGAIKAGRIGDFIKRELQRMPPMDVADVAYDRFLANGTPELFLEAEPGERVRIRIIDGSSTTFFHLQYAGGAMTVIGADGQDVEPFEVERMLIAVAETYDVYVTVPDSAAYELRATAHDGSAFATIWLGSGPPVPAPTVPKPRVYETMGNLSLGQIFALSPTSAMGMSNRDVREGKFDQPGMIGMNESKMSGSMQNMQNMLGMSETKVSDSMANLPNKANMGGSGVQDTSTSKQSEQNEDAMDAMPGMSHGSHTPSGSKEVVDRVRPPLPPREVVPAAIDPSLRDGKRFGSRFSPLASDASSAKAVASDGMGATRPWPPYEHLRATHRTAFDPRNSLRIVRLTLDGDMERYVWSINGKPLSESDSIVIRKDEVVRFIMINRTMMHHPMHLHGHFFRVINGQGDYAPLKHTVDVAPMSTTVIEFEANEFGEWFFHCHLLYHMESGMARTVHYEGYALPPLVSAVRSSLYSDPWYCWVAGNVTSNMTRGTVVASNIRNLIVGEWEVGWEKTPTTEWEGILSWRRYFNRFFTAFVGGDFAGAEGGNTTSHGLLGFTYLLPLLIDSRSWIASDGSARVAFEKEVTVLPRLVVYGESEYDTDTNWEGTITGAYTISMSMSITGRWHSDYGWGGGLTLRL